MLDELDRIPWHTLSHAYGPATDTPQHLRNLIHPDRTVMDEAHGALSASILHQGGISSAAIAAFPYLFNIFLTSTGRTRSSVSALVGGIIKGITPPIPSRRHFSEVMHKNKGNDDHPDAIAARATIYPFVIQNFPSLLPLLHDPDEDIASKTVQIIACCVAVDSALWLQIAPYAQTEHRPTFQAEYQLVAWASSNPVALRWVATTFVQSQEVLAKLAAALVLAHTTMPIPEVVTAWLSATIRANDWRLIEAYNALGLTRRYWFDCAIVLYSRPLLERIPLAEQCLTYLQSYGPLLSKEDIVGLLVLAFGRFHYKKSAIEPGDIHTTVVLWLAQCAFTTVERGYRVPQQLLRWFGLPWTPAAINGFLRLPNATHPAFATE